MPDPDQTTASSPAPGTTTPSTRNSTTRTSGTATAEKTTSGTATAEKTTSSTATADETTNPTATDSIDSAQSVPTVPTVDPRAPRFGQGLTASLLAVAVALRSPWLVALVALTLAIAVASRWRVDPYGILWRRVMVPLLGPPQRTETAAPHRFAKLIGAGFTLVATPLVLLGGAFAIPGYALAGVVAVLAGLAATTGFCLGCRLYGQLALARRLNLV